MRPPQTLLGLTGIASAAAASAIVATAPSAAADDLSAPSSSAAAAGVCDNRTDWRQQKTAAFSAISGPARTPGTVTLWYSPSSRCVFAQIVLNRNVYHGANETVGLSLIKHDSFRNQDYYADCAIPDGQSSCTTGKFYDGDIRDANGNDTGLNFSSRAFGRGYLYYADTGMREYRGTTGSY